MKYEFKPFCSEELKSDLTLGWKLTFRVAEDYPGGTPRDVEIVDLGPKAHYKYRLASIDLAEGGAVRMHDIYGRFDPSTSAPCVLDLILYREVPERPAERTVQGMAYVDAGGEIVSLRCMEASTEKVATSLTPVPCTITLHEQN